MLLIKTWLGMKRDSAWKGLSVAVAVGGPGARLPVHGVHLVLPAFSWFPDAQLLTVLPSPRPSPEQVHLSQRL